MTSSLCVLWARFGPYHLARLDAVHRQLPGGLVGLEIASQDATYAWREESSETPWRREVALPDRVYEDVPAQEIAQAVTAALDRIDPEAVAIPSYATPDARAALRWCRTHHRIAVMMSDSRAEDAERSGLREAIKRQLVRAFDSAFVAGTPHVEYAHALGLPREVIVTGYDVVDNAWFARGAEAARQSAGSVAHLPGLADPEPFFLASGRFVERKNLAMLLDAYARYRREADTPWRLLLLGDGPRRAALAEAASEGVTFCGFQQLDALPAYYGRAGAFVHPAQMDQWGLVVNEAMAASLPVLVSTGAGCAPDLVETGVNGWTFSPDDPDALADHLTHVASLPVEARDALGHASRQRIAAYSPESFAQNLLRAVEAGRPRSQRGLPLGTRATMTALRLAARRVTSFHAISE